MPSRLGVQFLIESEVNVCMGEGGRGVVMWMDGEEERRTRVKEAGRTVLLGKGGLGARVRALFGLA